MPPAEAEFRPFFRITPPVVHQMIKTLVDREPGKARSIRLRLTRAALPDLDQRPAHPYVGGVWPR
jgi:hypothetical protein